MPEGPEAHRVADRLAKAFRGVRVELGLGARPISGADRLSTVETVRAVEARGKAVLVHFASRHTLYAHSQLFGRWVIERASELSPSRRALRLTLRGEGWMAGLYSATDVVVLATTALPRHPYLQNLGPDPLSLRAPRPSIEERLADRAFADGERSTLDGLRSRIRTLARLHRARPWKAPPFRCPPTVDGAASSARCSFWACSTSFAAWRPC